MQIAAELGARPAQVKSAVELLDGGATVPFIARYRKEATDGLDDIQLRELEARLAYLRELEERRAAVLKSIDEQGKLTPELRAAIEAAPTKQELEDLYLPYKPKRRTKGMIAREAGLEPLADRLFADPTLDPLAEAAAFVNAEGRLCRRAWRCWTACATCCPSAGPKTPRWWASCANGCGPKACCRAKLMRRQGRERTPTSPSSATTSTTTSRSARVPSHRALAVFRGRTLEILDAKLVLDEEAGAAASRVAGRRPHRPATWAGATPSAPATT